MFTLEACGLPAAPINTLSNTIMFNEERILFFFNLQIHTSSAAKNEERALRMALEERPWGRPTLTALEQHECIQQIKWQSDYLSVRHLKFCAESILSSNAFMRASTLQGLCYFIFALACYISELTCFCPGSTLRSPIMFQPTDQTVSCVQMYTMIMCKNWLLKPETVVHLSAICAQSRLNLNNMCSAIAFSFLFVAESHKTSKRRSDVWS